jgi:hypothetical protein
MSLTIQVPIPDDLVPRLEERARTLGVDGEQYVRAIVSRALTGPRTFDEIVSGLRQEVAASGISDEELDDLLESAREESVRERHK